MLCRKLRLFSSITDFPQKVKILSFIRTRRTKNPHGSSTYAVPARIFQLFFVLFSSQRIDRIQICCFYRRQQSEYDTDHHGEDHGENDCRNTDRHSVCDTLEITCAMIMPPSTPSSPPMLVSTAASVRNWNRILRFLAPIAFFRPISLVRSVTDTSIIFITPIPPTRSEMLAIQISCWFVLWPNSCRLFAFSSRSSADRKENQLYWSRIRS